MNRDLLKFEMMKSCGHVVDVQLLNCAQLFATPWTAVCQPSLSFTISQNLFKLTSIELVMLSNHLILCLPLLLLPSVFPSIRVVTCGHSFQKIFLYIGVPNLQRLYTWGKMCPGK